MQHFAAKRDFLLLLCSIHSEKLLKSGKPLVNAVTKIFLVTDENITDFKVFSTLTIVNYKEIWGGPSCILVQAKCLLKTVNKGRCIKIIGYSKYKQNYSKGTLFSWLVRKLVKLRPLVCLN